MWRTYSTSTPSPHISRASFHRVVQAVTSGNQKVLLAVDYVTGCLVNDPVDVLRKIVQDFAASQQQTTELNALIDIICKSFLKSQYDAHALKGDGCALHGLQHCLDVGCMAPSQEPRQCNACNFPSYVIRHIHQVVQAKQDDGDVSADALRVLDDIQHKFDLFCGHRLRVMNQQQAIEDIHNKLREECLRTKQASSAAIVIADWKMKREPRYFRETTRQHFGKRGISWHGYLLPFTTMTPSTKPQFERPCTVTRSLRVATSRMRAEYLQRWKLFFALYALDCRLFVLSVCKAIMLAAIAAAFSLH
eukprot:m.329274 g.329274  ORF g.329274 m.329274 type:complete len:305 (+) comp16036_c0_seq18:1172-2086(+)